MKRPLSSSACTEAGQHIEDACGCDPEPETDSECLLLILRELRYLSRTMSILDGHIEAANHEQRMQRYYGGNR